MILLFYYKQKTAYEMRISDWSSDVCSSDLAFSHEGLEDGADARRVLAADQPERHLRRCLGRDHRLAALAGVAAPDAVHVAGRPRPDPLQKVAAALARGKQNGRAHV